MATAEAAADFNIINELNILSKIDMYKKENLNDIFLNSKGIRNSININGEMIKFVCNNEDERSSLLKFLEINKFHDIISVFGFRKFDLIVSITANEDISDNIFYRIICNLEEEILENDEKDIKQENINNQTENLSKSKKEISYITQLTNMFININNNTIRIPVIPLTKKIKDQEVKILYAAEFNYYCTVILGYYQRMRKITQIEFYDYIPTEKLNQTYIFELKEICKFLNLCTIRESLWNNSRRFQINSKCWPLLNVCKMIRKRFDDYVTFKNKENKTENENFYFNINSTIFKNSFFKNLKDKHLILIIHFCTFAFFDIIKVAHEDISFIREKQDDIKKAIIDLKNNPLYKIDNKQKISIDNKCQITSIKDIMGYLNKKIIYMINDINNKINLQILVLKMIKHLIL